VVGELLRLSAATDVGGVSEDVVFAGTVELVSAGAVAGSAARSGKESGSNDNNVSKNGISDLVGMRTSIGTPVVLRPQSAAYYKNRGGDADAFGYDRHSRKDITSTTITTVLTTIVL
jgi:hypothetical protein